jgi:parvulin-like peptidyl-prolyl isomerase
MTRAAFLAALLLAASAPARAEVVDGVAAIVGDEVVLLSEVRTAMQSVLARVPQGQSSPDELRQLRDSAEGPDRRQVALQIATTGRLRSEEEIDSAVADRTRRRHQRRHDHAAAADQALARVPTRAARQAAHAHEDGVRLRAGRVRV